MNELTGRELDRAIAVALGWTVREVSGGGTWGTGYALFTPDGKRWRHPHPVSVTAPTRNTEDEAWSNAPAFQADANAVIAVCAERGWTVRYEIDDEDPEHVEWVVWVETDTLRPNTYGRLTNEYDGRSAANWQEAGARALLTALTAGAGA